MKSKKDLSGNGNHFLTGLFFKKEAGKKAPLAKKQCKRKIKECIEKARKL